MNIIFLSFGGHQLWCSFKWELLRARGTMAPWVTHPFKDCWRNIPITLRMPRIFRVMASPWLPTSFRHSPYQAFPVIRRENESLGLRPKEIQHPVPHHRTAGRGSALEACGHVVDPLPFRCRMKAV